MVPKLLKEAGFELHHAYREGKRGGGVATLYKKKINAKEESASCLQYKSYVYITLTVNSNTDEWVWVEPTSPGANTEKWTYSRSKYM